MCGITGFLDSSESTSSEKMMTTIRRMTDTLRHRGPDDTGTWIDPFAGIALGHQRLAILERSSAGHQPMVSKTGRYLIIFNGEIYNHLTLRHELEQSAPAIHHPLLDASYSTEQKNATGWRGHSDTETLLALIESVGVGEALKRCVGMFALGLWDRHDKCLYLAKDRLGEKPLYYGWNHHTLIFGSELKALCAYPNFQGEVDRDALTLFLRYGYIPAPFTIYKGFFKLLPGSYVVLSRHKKGAQPIFYWTVQDAILRGRTQPFSGSDKEAVAMLDTQLRTTISEQMVADVPLGAFLSGGIDSSTVVAIMQAHSSRPVRTFTIGFEEPDYDEAKEARAVASHLGTEHTELYIKPEEALAVIPRLPILYDEPFADVSQIPTFLVAQLARQQVTVSVTGDGGDELWGGYYRYHWTRMLWSKTRYLPRSVRTTIAKMLTVIPPYQWNALFRILRCVLPKKHRYATPGDKLYKVATLLGALRPEDIFIELLSHWKEPTRVVKNGTEPITILRDSIHWPELRECEHRMMYLDTVSYLPDDILVKVDRAAMGVGLETRAPFLDHRMVELAWKCPLSMKIREGEAKWLLRQVLYQYIPPHLVNRPKKGFGVPLDQWLRGPLREWAETLLQRARLEKEGYFHPLPIREQWEQHLSEQHNRSYPLWNVLMFQAWLETRH